MNDPRNTLPYGRGSISLTLPDTIESDWIEPAAVSPALDPTAVVWTAVQEQIEKMRGAQRVAIAVNDKTRPVPHKHLLPPLLDGLREAGVEDDQILFLVATGTHVPMRAEEMPRILPADICEKYRVISHDCDSPDLISLGATTRGTRVLANRQFMEADLRIVVGNIEPHHFAGFSGGYKTAAIGLAGRETITHNHAMLVEPGAEIGNFTGNPLRQDIEEIGSQMGVHLALNAVLNENKKIVYALCGSPREIIQAGIPLSQKVCQVDMRQRPGGGEKYDIVIASAGGYPKDINFYQAQKALTHAALFVRNGGVIILTAECEEGVGSASYVEFMRELHTNEEVFAKMRQAGFQVGPHKAFQVARISSRATILMVSSIPREVVTSLLMNPAASMGEAVARACRLAQAQPGRRLRAAVLPRATNTIPVFPGSGTNSTPAMEYRI